MRKHWVLSPVERKERTDQPRPRATACTQAVGVARPHSPTHRRFPWSLRSSLFPSRGSPARAALEGGARSPRVPAARRGPVGRAHPEGRSAGEAAVLVPVSAPPRPAPAWSSPGRAARRPLRGAAAVPGLGDSPRQRPHAAASAPRSNWDEAGSLRAGPPSEPRIHPPARPAAQKPPVPPSETPGLRSPGVRVPAAPQQRPQTAQPAPAPRPGRQVQGGGAVLQHQVGVGAAGEQRLHRPARG